VLAVAAAAGIWVQRADLTAGVSSLAEQQARTLAADVPEGSPGPDPASEEAIVQIVSLDGGRVLSGSPDARDRALVPAPAGLAPVHHRIRGPVPDEPDRYEVVALRSVDGTSYVVVARSLEAVDAATASTSILLLVGGLLVLLATGALTWRATGRALAPVEAMRRRAASISAKDLGDRLPVPASQAELARLAATLNELLARIDAATKKERQFVADASHELRSPLATIRALLESDRLSPHPGGHAGLTGEVLAETDRLTMLVNDLLRLARGDARRPVTLGRVDMSALVGAEERRARRIPVTAAIAPGLEVTGDADALGIALRNLIDNAQRFAASEVRVTARRDGGQVCVSVADDGPGIRAQDRERVFERFVRLDDDRSRPDGGAGLGLAITRQVAEAHGGTVAVTASPELSGATLTMRLPALTDAHRGRTET
jgi:signal transduction histidine kinase